MSNLTVGKKIWILSGVLGAALMLIGGFGYQNSKTLSNHIDKLSRVQIPLIRNVTLIDMHHDGIRGTTYVAMEAVNRKNPKEIEEKTEELVSTAKEVDNLVATIEKLEIDEETKTELAKAKADLALYQNAAYEAAKVFKTGDVEQSQKSLVKVEEWFGKLEVTLGAFGDKIEKNSEEYSQKAEAEAQTSIFMAAIMLFGALAVAVSFSVIITKQLVSSLSSVITQLDEQALSLSASATQMNQEANTLSSVSAEQSSAVQETAASMEEISSMVKKTEEGSKQLREFVDKSYQQTSSGRESVQSVLAAMGSIKESNANIFQQTEQSNKEISEIVNVITEIGEKTKVINDIVFQTRLLSFNASVEAARAGEHGKGFAVVAEEVGNLAQMSGNAAKEISNMLAAGTEKAKNIVIDNKNKIETLMNTSMKEVSHGNEVAQKCDEIFKDLAETMKSAHEMTAQISGAISEQTQGTQEVSKAIHIFNESTQKSQHISNETSSIAENLLLQATKLSQAMETLKAQVQSQAKQNAKIINMPVNPSNANKSEAA